MRWCCSFLHKITCTFGAIRTKVGFTQCHSCREMTVAPWREGSMQQQHDNYVRVSCVSPVFGCLKGFTVHPAISKLLKNHHTSSRNPTIMMAMTTMTVMAMMMMMMMMMMMVMMMMMMMMITSAPRWLPFMIAPFFEVSWLRTRTYRKKCPCNAQASGQS